MYRLSIFSKVKKNEYAKNSTILMTGTVISMILKAITAIVLSNYLGDALLGVSGIYTASYSILLIVATGRYELSIMLPKDDNDGFMLMILSSGLSFVFSALMMILLSIFSAIFSFSLGWIWFLPITLAVLGTYFSINYWLNRKKQYKKLAVNRILQGILYFGFCFLFYFIEFTKEYSLILGYIFSQATVLIILIIYAICDYKKYNIKVKFSRIKELAIKNIDFPRISVASGVVNNLATRLPVFLLQYFCGIKVVGQYTLMEQVFAAPIAIISESIRDVFRQKASKDYAEDNECYNTYYKTFKTLAISAIAPFLLIMIGAKPIISLVFSDEFNMAAIFIIIMAPFYYVKFIVSPLTFMSYIANKQGFDMKWQMLFCISSASAFMIGYFVSHNPYIMMALYGVALGIMYVINFYYTRRFAKGEL